ncbi:transposase, IS630 family [Armillaria gallica]|uniref:Transposase, IS630 family n=1 Tax=Armillaria gallica TaxID=47427 RepID=A0A2H3CCU2_ARMGA|nr:transposase, IS630 family [Armillaria gallica]
MILYLPPYSPDLNPIEESFSTCMYRSHYGNNLIDLLHRESLSVTKWANSP